MCASSPQTTSQVPQSSASCQLQHITYHCLCSKKRLFDFLFECWHSRVWCVTGVSQFEISLWEDQLQADLAQGNIIKLLSVKIWGIELSVFCIVYTQTKGVIIIYFGLRTYVLALFVLFSDFETWDSPTSLTLKWILTMSTTAFFQGVTPFSFRQKRFRVNSIRNLDLSNMLPPSMLPGTYSGNLNF